MSAPKLPQDSHRVQGAYGLRFEGLSTPLLVSPAPMSWPLVELTQQVGVSPSERSTYRDHAIDLAFPSGWGMRLQREPAAVTLLVNRRVSDDEVVHPLLVQAVMHFAAWLGRVAFHGGAFVQHGRAFGVIAESTGGKSTTLARLADRGVPVLADDALIVERGCALAGPRCIDLRPTAASDRSLASVRGDARRRLTLPPIEPSAPLAGVFALGWNDELSVRRLRPSERLVALARHCRPEIGRMPALLDISRLPVWRVERPRDSACLDEVCDRLLAAALG